MKIEIQEFESLSYLTCFPDNFSENGKYPIIIHLHVMGAIPFKNEIERIMSNE